MGLLNHIPFVNRFVGWWARMRESNWLKAATPEKRAGDAATQVRGDLEADVALRGRVSLERLEITGFLRNSNVIATGNLQKVIVGGLDHANIFVGLAERPDERGDFNAGRRLGSFTVEGVRGSANAFIDSNVAAANIGSVFVTRIDTDTDGERFGIFADAIRSYQRGAFTAQDRSTSQAFDRLGDYRVRIF